ncbi:MAG: hypothetical protein ACLGPL_11345 [Acidobacteriota bacterium]
MKLAKRHISDVKTSTERWEDPGERFCNAGAALAAKSYPVLEEFEGSLYEYELEKGEKENGVPLSTLLQIKEDMITDVFDHTVRPQEILPDDSDAYELFVSFKAGPLVRPEANQFERHTYLVCALELKENRWISRHCLSKNRNCSTRRPRSRKASGPGSLP